jgi:hypothetical protein
MAHQSNAEAGAARDRRRKENSMNDTEKILIGDSLVRAVVVMDRDF